MASIDRDTVKACPSLVRRGCSITHAFPKCRSTQRLQSWLKGSMSRFCFFNCRFSRLLLSLRERQLAPKIYCFAGASDSANAHVYRATVLHILLADCLSFFCSTCAAQHSSVLSRLSFPAHELGATAWPTCGYPALPLTRKRLLNSVEVVELLQNYSKMALVHRPHTVNVINSQGPTEGELKENEALNKVGNAFSTFHNVV
jgi:hypothetical protein